MKVDGQAHNAHPPYSDTGFAAAVTACSGVRNREIEGTSRPNAARAGASTKTRIRHLQSR